MLISNDYYVKNCGSESGTASCVGLVELVARHAFDSMQNAFNSMQNAFYPMQSANTAKYQLLN